MAQDFDRVHFGHTLRIAMARKNYTQHDLSKAIEQITGKKPAQTTISYWLRTDDKGKSPNVKMLPALLEALDLTWEDIAPNHTPEPASRHPRLKSADLVQVPVYNLDGSQLERSSQMRAFDKHLVGAITSESLGSLIVPAGWDTMIRFVEPGYRMLIEVYPAPVSLRQVFAQGRFRSGVYLLSFSAGLHLHRLQELPGGQVLVLSDNEAYRDVKLSVSGGDDVMLYARVLDSEGPS